MNLLPSEQKEKLEEALREWQENGRINIYEPCDCGSRIRHNNGGNYHQEIYLRRDKGKVFVKFETTRELVARKEWEETSEEDALRIIEQNADWL